MVHAFDVPRTLIGYYTFGWGELGLSVDEAGLNYQLTINIYEDFLLEYLPDE